MHVDCGHIVTEPKPPKIQTKNHTVWLEKDGIDFALYCLALDFVLTKIIFSSKQLQFNNLISNYYCLMPSICTHHLFLRF